MSLTRELVDRVWQVDSGQLEADDLEAFRSLLLDHLGVAAAGAQTDSAASMRTFVGGGARTGSSEFPIVGTDQSAEPTRAAMANAVAAHSIEYDDVHNASSSHPGVVVIPAALSIAEMVNASDEELVLAVVRGYEVMCRVGRAANPAAHYGRHFHPTGTAGHFGSATAVSSLMGLDVDQTVAALGIAATMAAGSMQFLLDGAWTKRLHPAFAARNGIEAAQLARSGFRGTKDGIGGDRGFLNGYSDNPSQNEVLLDWGYRPWEIRNTSIKAHTCCRYKQGPIDALLKIRTEQLQDPSEIRSIVIGIPSVAEDIIWQPTATKKRSMTTVDAQFSMPFGAAIAMYAGRASLPEYDGSLFDEPEVVRLMDLTECVVDPALDLTYPAQWRAWVEVGTSNGWTYRADVDNPKGDPTNPLSSDELE